MKAFTDLEQSKKIAEILPFESADGFYEAQLNEKGEWEYFLFVGSKWASSDVVVPCWSLAALLNVLPSGKILVHDKESCKYKCICKNIDTHFCDNPIDACIELIDRLKDENLI